MSAFERKLLAVLRCLEKLSWPDRGAAKRFSKRHRNTLHLRVYKCGICGRFHLTKQKGQRAPLPPGSKKREE